MEKYITAPIKKGEILGNVNIYIDNELVGQIDIKANENVEKLTPFITAKWIFKAIFKI